jgi:hypothetical protein
MPRDYPRAPTLAILREACGPTFMVFDNRASPKPLCCGPRIS